ncbi:hypothetical protein E3N88_34469 [Mikania micrantha]|uniref:Uncharacterized protein n=1 Tax=Mikania micrantha TaxID=192012 RepID=A0A5N6LY80_9ASTR|nr:hypothetical protein E3N88_34469 [Mikania micrantha]
MELHVGGCSCMWVFTPCMGLAALKPSGNDLLGGSSDGVDEDKLPSFLLCFKPSKSSNNGFQAQQWRFSGEMMRKWVGLLEI